MDGSQLQVEASLLTIKQEAPEAPCKSKPNSRPSQSSTSRSEQPSRQVISTKLLVGIIWSNIKAVLAASTVRDFADKRELGLQVPGKAVRLPASAWGAMSALAGGSGKHSASNLPLSRSKQKIDEVQVLHGLANPDCMLEATAGAFDQPLSLAADAKGGGRNQKKTSRKAGVQTNGDGQCKGRDKRVSKDAISRSGLRHPHGPVS